MKLWSFFGHSVRRILTCSLIASLLSVAWSGSERVATDIHDDIWPTLTSEMDDDLQVVVQNMDLLYRDSVVEGPLNQEEHWRKEEARIREEEVEEFMFRAAMWKNTEKIPDETDDKHQNKNNNLIRAQSKKIDLDISSKTADVSYSNAPSVDTSRLSVSQSRAPKEEELLRLIERQVNETFPANASGNYWRTTFQSSDQGGVSNGLISNSNSSARTAEGINGAGVNSEAGVGHSRGKIRQKRDSYGDSGEEPVKDQENETTTPSSEKCYIDVRIALLLPLDNRRMFSIQKVLPAVQQALSSSTVKRILPRCRFTIFLANSQCSSVAAPLEAFDLIAIDKVHVFFGPVCDYSLGPVARYASHWDIPVISPGGMATDFSVDRTEHDAPFSMLTRVGMTFDGLAYIIYNAILRYDWKHVKILYSSKGHEEIMNMFCYLAMSAVMSLLTREDIDCPSFSFERIEEEEDVAEMLKQEVGVEHAIVILCNSPDAVRNVMIKAAEMNFANGDYIFFNVDPISSEEQAARPWYRDSDATERNERARQAYEYVKTIRLREPHTLEYEQFSRQVIRRARWKFNEPVFDENTKHGQPVNNFVVAFHDGVLLYAKALNATLEAGYSADNGSHVTLMMRNRTFRGIRGPVTIDGKGDRINDYSVLDMDPDTGVFEPVADYHGFRRAYVPRPGKYMRWGRGHISPPPDVPRCGYDNSNCPEQPSSARIPDVVIVIVAFMMITVGLAILVLFIHRRYKEAAVLAESYWRVRWEDITLGFPEKRSDHHPHPSRFERRSSSLFIGLTGARPYETFGLLSESRQPTFTKTGFYKGSLVAVKRLHKPITRPITQQLLMELKQILNLQHDHIVRFIGICLDEPNQCILTEYCHKGSLQDVLDDDEFHIDNLFRLSLIQDIARGMTYLHGSNMRSHGNLKSSNCLVNGRFVVKLTDFGLESLRDRCEDRHFRIETVGVCEECCRENLWTAPELLRMTSSPVGGTQKGDVYSFGIICQEVLYNRGPFWIQDRFYTPREIVELVKRGGQPYLRPTLRVRPEPETEGMEKIRIHCSDRQRDGNHGDEQLGQFIEDIAQCWSEDPELRPHFQYISQVIVLYQSENNRDCDTGCSIVDSLLSRMELYANNLESVVEERTGDYLQQRRRAEYLLHQMIPRSAADQLLRGEMVKPEKFDCVTVYFSDICGFTSLSASSSPLQVVDMLNELYTSFDAIVDGYDVYKVETIGDAYMVASYLSHNQSETVPAEHYFSSTSHNDAPPTGSAQSVLGFQVTRGLLSQTVPLLAHKRQNHQSGPSSCSSVNQTIKRSYSLSSPSYLRLGRSNSTPPATSIHAHHACEIARMALALRNYVMNFRIRHKPTEQLKLRIGVHSGPCCGGIVGLKMPRYCLVGETINTASELQSTGEPLMIHMSSETRLLLDQSDTFEIEKRGPVHIEGKGEMLTWWLLAEKDIDASATLIGLKRDPGHASLDDIMEVNIKDTQGHIIGTVESEKVT